MFSKPQESETVEFKSSFQKELGVPSKTLERWIKQLKEEDKIKFIGSKKTGGYVVK